MNINKINLRKNIWTICSVLEVAVIFALFMIVVAKYSPAFPRSDDWNFIASAANGEASSVRWYFMQHVDHRIPIQKLAQILILKFTNFDYRYLVSFNMLIAAFASISFIIAARIARGVNAIGDLFIPLVLMSFGTGYSQWDFEFQFLSSIFFSSLYLLFMMLHAKRMDKSNKVMFFLSLLSIGLCSWCGLNGLIISSFVSVLLIIYFISQYFSKSYSRSLRVELAALIIVLLQNAVLWVLWVPSGASNMHANFYQVMKFIYEMIKSPLIVYASTDPVWKFMLIGALILASYYLAAAEFIKKMNLESVAKISMIGSGTILIVSTAFGRAKENPWQPGLEMHYGTLAFLLLIGAWIVFSSNTKSSIYRIVGIVFVLLFIKADIANYDWRRSYDRSVYISNRNINAAINSNQSVDKVIDKYMKSLYFVDTIQTRAQVRIGIEGLRKLRGK